MYSSEIKHSEATVEQYRVQIGNHQCETYGFASLVSISAAHGTAYDLRGEHPKGMTIQLAPNPNDIVSIARNVSSFGLIASPVLEEYRIVIAKTPYQKDHWLYFPCFPLCLQFDSLVSYRISCKLDRCALFNKFCFYLLISHCLL